MVASFANFADQFLTTEKRGAEAAARHTRYYGGDVSIINDPISRNYHNDAPRRYRSPKSREP